MRVHREASTEYRRRIGTTAAVLQPVIFCTSKRHCDRRTGANLQANPRRKVGVIQVTNQIANVDGRISGDP